MRRDLRVVERGGEGGEFVVKKKKMRMRVRRRESEKVFFEGIVMMNDDNGV